MFWALTCQTLVLTYRFESRKTSTVRVAAFPLDRLQLCEVMQRVQVRRGFRGGLSPSSLSPGWPLDHPSYLTYTSAKRREELRLVVHWEVVSILKILIQSCCPICLWSLWCFWGEMQQICLHLPIKFIRGLYVNIGHYFTLSHWLLWATI